MNYCPNCQARLYEHAEACKQCNFALKNRGRLNRLWPSLFGLGVAEGPEDAILHKLRGNELVRARRYKQALREYDYAIKLDPLYSDAFNNRGAAFQHLGLYERALEDHRTAVRLDPWDAVAHYNLGNDLQSLGQHWEAIASYDTAVEINPRFAEAYTNRGVAFFNVGEHERAIDNYNRSVHINPALSDAYNNRGNAFVDDQTLRGVEGRREDPREAQADEWATEALVPQAAWEASAARERPTPIAVMNLAHALQVHPAIIAGKIRYEQHNYRLLSQFVGTGEVRRQLGLTTRG